VSLLVVSIVRYLYKTLVYIYIYNIYKYKEDYIVTVSFIQLLFHFMLILIFYFINLEIYNKSLFFSHFIVILNIYVNI